MASDEQRFFRARNQDNFDFEAKRRTHQSDREDRPYSTRINWHRPPYRVGTILAVALLAFSLLACDAPTVNLGGNPTPITSNLPGNAQFNTWYSAASGVEVRYEDWNVSGGASDTVTIVRVDPHAVTLSVGYQPDKPLLMSHWMQQEHSVAIINGGYFDQNDRATALVISNGQIYGSTYTGFGGMLAVDKGEHISLRSLQQQPYIPGESLTQAIQCSPMLMLDGKRTQFTASDAQSRRSIVAMDKRGRLLFISSPDDIFSLDQMADLLASSDLSISIALNMDGGSSTGLFVNGNGKSQVTIDSYVPLPLVVIVREK
ncbi:MAG TPA: phosphodiester glycosidase family protein [Ktedonobacteraceae bacterium]|nr:phosphodiester glycosidase family protein [Ktedonobacteraceae bacterium]